MRQVYVALLAAALLAGPAASVSAQDSGQISPCLDYAGYSALPSLQQAHQFNPSTGYGQYGWDALTIPYGSGPIGRMTAFSPPGLVAAYGPLGPGPTAANIAGTMIPPGGFGFNNASVNNTVNVQTALGLAGLQQGELGNMYGRYAVGTASQITAATWAIGLSSRAASTFAILLGLCLNHNPPQPPTPSAPPDRSLSPGS
jgi:hypothetical protein